MNTPIDYYNYLTLKQSVEPITAKQYYQYIAKFFRQYDDMTQENVEKFLTEHKENLQASSYNKILLDLNRYIKWAKLPIDITEYKRKREVEKTYDWIEEKEVDEIIDKLPLMVEDSIRVRPFLLLLYHTGLRPREILALEKKDFDFENRRLMVRITKGKKHRPLVLPKKIIKDIKDSFHVNPNSDLVFDFDYRHVIVVFNNLNKYMNPRFKLVPYSFRRGFAQDTLTKCKGDIRPVSRAMGHKSTRTTERYLKINEEKAFEMLKKVIK